MAAWLTALAAWLAVLPAASAAAPSKKDGNRACLRCHAMATMAVRDEVTGGIVSLAVDPAKFAESNHRKLQCTFCHSKEFKWFPHPEETSGERLRCLDCHRDDPKLRKRRFPEIGREVAASIHVRKLGRRFDCFACHDPHTFRLAGEAAAVRVPAANAVCLGCHATRERFSALTARVFPELDVTHAWLPNAPLHWRKVRCLDCHAGRPVRRGEEPALGHRILEAKRAERGCADCHTRDSVLFTTLYRYTAKESRAKLGFVDAALLNDAYVIGATRNVVVDRLWLGALLFAFAGIVVHATLRWRTPARRGPAGGRKG